MGWVSMTEDIEKLRQEREHLKKGFDSLKAGTTNLEYLSRSYAESELKKLSETQFLDEIERRALQVFDEAEARFNDPNVRIIARLQKKEGELAIAKEVIQRLKSDLAASRDANQRLRREHDSVSAELHKVRGENQSLRDKLLWHESLDGVRGT